MEDYIDALLLYLSEQPSSAVNSRYLAALRREKAACEALWNVLPPEQHKLFLDYEAARNETASVSMDEFARQAFLLAREIFR